MTLGALRVDPPGPLAERLIPVIALVAAEGADWAGENQERGRWWAIRGADQEVCTGGGQSAPPSTTCSARFATGIAARWSSMARPASGSPRSWTTSPRRRQGYGVLRATGAESEMELPFASLHQLCVPLLDGVKQLPPPQRDALDVAFGRATGPVPDRFLVGLAVLTLLSRAAENRPVLCVIDDAQWLDEVSARTLTFVARRLLADPVGLVLATRDPLGSLEGLPELEILGLRNGDARAVLRSALTFRLDDRIRDRIVAETHGNPLALLELSRGLTAEQLAGGFDLLGVPRQALPTRLEENFRRRVEAMPPSVRLLHADRGRRAGRRPGARTASRRAHRRRDHRSTGHRRAAHDRGVGEIPASARALGRVSVSAARPAPPGAPGAGRGDRRSMSIPTVVHGTSPPPPSSRTRRSPRSWNGARIGHGRGEEWPRPPRSCSAPSV